MEDAITFAVIGGVILILLWLITRNKTSEFTFQPFDNLKNAQEVTDSFKTQTQQISTELKAELIKAKTDKKSKEELIVIADKFNDYSCQLSKAYARWSINNAM